MRELRKTSLYVWIGTLFLFLALVAINYSVINYAPNYTRAASILIVAGLMIDVSVGVFSFLVLVFTDAIIKTREEQILLLPL